MNVGFHHFHHFHLRRSHQDSRIKAEKKLSIVRIIDSLVYVGGFTGVMFIIPQLAKIWVDQQVQGLSLITWLGFLGGTIFWLFYGIVHKVRPIIFINLIYSIMNTLIVIGIIIFK